MTNKLLNIITINTMRKYNILTFLLAFMVLLTSCNKYLEEMPQNKLMPTTISDYEQLLNRAYVTEQILPFLDALSDDVALIAAHHAFPTNDRGDVNVSAYMWDQTHETSMVGGDNAFARFYESILYSNLVINEVEKAEGDELNVANNKIKSLSIKGEAMVLRAYSYFYLVNLYGEPFDPATAANAMGIPINLSALAEDVTYNRSSVQEVYEQITSDMEEGVKLLKENQYNNKSKFRFNLISANAFLSRVYLYTHKWEKAAIAAKEVISATNGVVFSLHDAGNVLSSATYTSGWGATTKGLYGQDYLHKDNANILFINGLNENVSFLSYYDTHTTFSVNRDFESVFEPSDIRKFYFMKPQNWYGKNGLITKLTYAKNRYKSYMDVYNCTPSSGYSRTIRTEEMYLNAAEAYAQLGRSKDALDMLNALRVTKFRQGEYTTLEVANFNKQSLIDFTLLDRRRELCFEGHRWFDLRRTTRPAMTRVGYDNQVATLVKNDPKYVLQIPASELSVNPGIGPAPR